MGRWGVGMERRLFFAYRIHRSNVYRTLGRQKKNSTPGKSCGELRGRRKVDDMGEVYVPI